jgi:hypothetical protein
MFCHVLQLYEVLCSVMQCYGVLCSVMQCYAVFSCCSAQCSVQLLSCTREQQAMPGMKETCMLAVGLAKNRYVGFVSTDIDTISR